MTLARVGALAVLTALVTVTACERAAHSTKPDLALLTSLPIVLGEDFSLKSTGSPALTALSAQFRVRPISTTSAADLAHVQLLLMAQPPAQSPENLVALDAWVHSGGRLLLLADPLLEWPSKRPLGDRLRPPLSFVDTGLVAHWGLRLDAPDRRGPAVRHLSGYPILTVSPGSLYGRACAISRDRLVADCRIGKGRAVVVADADFLKAETLGSSASANLNALVAETAALEA